MVLVLILLIRGKVETYRHGGNLFLEPIKESKQMGFYTDLISEGYIDTTYGVVSNTKGFCDNFHLFTAESMLVAGWNLWPQYTSFYKGCEIEPGLIVRYPGRTGGGISQDEMIGAATLDENAAKRIYAYGQAHWWCFNPDKVSFSLSNWYGRFLDFKPYIKMRAGEKLNIFQQAAWSIMTVLSPMSSEGNTSGKLLKWSQLRSMEGKYWLCDQAIKFYRWRMQRQYPGGVKQVMGIYFGTNHPITCYSRNDFK